MIERIIEYSIRNRFLVIAATFVAAAWGVYAVVHTPVDAIPDLSENQVIVFTDWMGRSPREIEDQVTYPLSVNLQGLAGVKAVRSSSEFNFSMINIIFEDDVDFYFARQRVLERLTLAGTFLPPGVVPYLAPDATALGQIFWYTVEGNGYDPGRLRAIQDWYVRYQLNSVPGVAQVASVGGYPIEYQIDVDPQKLRAYGVTLGELHDAVARANSAVGGRVMHKGNAEYLIRGVGWIGADADVIGDIESIVVRSDPEQGTPIYVSNLATVGVGTQIRRSVLEKDGNEVTGGVVMMRYGENPLEVTRAIKHKIEQLGAGLPPGVRIVPFYDRTRLIHGAVRTLTEILAHEMIIASLAIFLILWHFRSALLICATLPLAVLASFILMRLFHIPSNIMSLAGIAISIGVLVDQAIVMVENATHHLTEKFGSRKVEGDTREIVIPACRTVGRPIFFSVMIILISFLPVFALRGMEGKTFHPLAFTKSFAMIGVAILSITFVPALIPTFVRGRIRHETESWIVRTMIGIYRPVLTWALPRWNLVLWSFAVLLIVAAGLFPLDAVFGVAWRTGFLVTWSVVTAMTVVFMQGRWPQVAGLVSLVAVGYWAYGFERIGVEYMPPLDEGSIMDMPITVPRASVTQAADDLKVRDQILRGFPEVEMVVGKAGRADTPTDPAPLDMIETVVNLHPKEFWPKRQLRYVDAERQTGAVLEAIEARGWLREPSEPFDRAALVGPATMHAVGRLDQTLRSLVVQRDAEFQGELARYLSEQIVTELIRRWQRAGRVVHPPEASDLDALRDELAATYGARLAAGPAQEDVNQLVQSSAERLADAGVVVLDPGLLSLERGSWSAAWTALRVAFGAERPTLLTDLWHFVHRVRDRQWVGRLPLLDRELFDRAVGAYNWFAIEGLAMEAAKQGAWSGPETPHPTLSPKGRGGDCSVGQSNPEGNGDHDTVVRQPVPEDLAAGSGLDSVSSDDALEPLRALRAELDPAFARRLLLWHKTKDDLVKEMDSALQMPGWGNIWTQPIINRIDMLATGVRTMIGVKVFGNDLDQIQAVSEEIARQLRTVPGAVDVFPDQNVGKGYLEIRIDRRRAARYGVSVAAIQDVIEIALGGKAVTMTVEGRERHPVRIRYARAFREDEERIKNLLVSGGMRSADGGGMGAESAMTSPPPADSGRNSAEGPIQVPLKMVAEVEVVEGPAMIKSENGMLRSYVQLNVRDHDVVGFVEQARRVVEQNVVLPAGMYLEWSGQFEHQERARNTLRIVWPAVMALIFLILYLTYNDMADAVLMMMAVPEALAGGILFLWLTQFGFLGLEPKHFSTAVQIGFIACFGMATETGIIMLVYLREAIERRGGLEKIASLEELRDAVIEGAVHRLRPKLLTEGVAIVALAPMLWHSGVGHEVISAMAVPVLGGLLIADEVVDIFIPVRFYWVRRRRWLQIHGAGGAEAAASSAVVASMPA